ncbi:AI-2E family transporter [Roseomonas elaeocarpi]|uniref:AI-2E family transporter n=1 Tax=Roseomonas elaeocarpi TaxID=907779 RepID=A0ABV6JQV9_9PROT
MTRSTLSITVLLVAFVLLCWLVPNALLIAFAGALLAVALRALAAPIVVKTGLSGGWAVLVVALLIVVVFGLGIWAAIGPLTEQAQAFAQQVPQALRSLQDSLSNYPWIQGQINKFQPEQLMSSVGESAAGVAASGIFGTVGAIGNVVLMVLLALYLAAEPSLYRRGSIAFLSPDLRARGMHVLDAAGASLRGWLLGALCAMVFNGVLIWLGLWALGVPLSGLLGAIAAVTSFVPYIGAISAAVPAALMALGKEPSLVPWALGVYFLVQMLEGNVLTPLVQKRTTDLPPALLLISQTVMGTVAGILGVVLAAPLTAVAMTVIRMTYIEERLEGGEHLNAAEAEARADADKAAAQPSRPLSGEAISRRA